MQPRAERHGRRGGGGDGPARRGASSARRAPVRGAERRRAAGQRGGDRGAGARRTSAAARRRRWRRTMLEDPSGYGRVVRDERRSGASAWWRPRREGDATRRSSRSARSTRASTRSTRRRCCEALPRLSADNAQGELYLPQVLDLLRARRRRGRGARRRGPDAGARRQRPRGAGAGARARAAARSTSGTCAPGVTIVDPRRTVIDVDVRDRAGHDDRAVHDDQGRARGSARGCTVEPLLPGRLRCSRTASSVGPFAYLRPGRGAARGRQGGDVRGGQELRHRRRRERSRTSPTSATRTWARARTSGRATITANYDGRAKHRTTIGKRVRGGVDTAFVAPVTVGDDAYTAAGSVVTEDVPRRRAGDARGRRQENIEGYAERRGAASDSRDFTLRGE